jgi:5-methylcytosine-specific restriction endonuclease McrA
MKASSVDHIIPKAHGGTDDDFNLESLCWTRYSKKTATENPMKSFKIEYVDGVLT